MIAAYHLWLHTMYGQIWLLPTFLQIHVYKFLYLWNFFASLMRSEGAPVVVAVLRRQWRAVVAQMLKYPFFSQTWLLQVAPSFIGITRTHLKCYECLSRKVHQSQQHFLWWRMFFHGQVFEHLNSAPVYPEEFFPFFFELPSTQRSYALTVYYFMLFSSGRQLYQLNYA